VPPVHDDDGHAGAHQVPGTGLMNFRFGQYVSGQIYILILRTKCATQNTNVLCTTWTNFLQAKHTYKLLQNMHLPPNNEFSVTNEIHKIDSRRT
jgi:hypothetical protein